MTSSNDGPYKPSEKTYNLLYAKSNNRCAFPGCKNPITLNRTLVGNVCHIKAANRKGPRYDSSQTNKERHGYDNLVLMCTIHNKVIDDDKATYTVERLKEIKADHEAASTPIPAENIKLAVELLVSGDGTATIQTRDITVTATTTQNSIVAGVYQNIVNNFVPEPSSSALSVVPNFVFVFGAPLGDNNSATWIMTAKHYGPGPAHNCIIDFYDNDRKNIRHEWLLKHPDCPFAPPELVGEFRHQIRIAEAGSEGPLAMFNWIPLDPDRQHYSVSISSRDGVFVENWEVTRVDGHLRSKITIERGPNWIEKNPNSDPVVFKVENPEFIHAPLLVEVPQSRAANVHPGWKPNHKFEVPVAIIDPNGNLQVMSAPKAPDGSAITDFGSWNILTRHFGDEARPSLTWEIRYPGGLVDISPTPEGFGAIKRLAIAESVVIVNTSNRNISLRSNLLIQYGVTQLALKPINIAPQQWEIVLDRFGLRKKSLLTFPINLAPGTSVEGHIAFQVPAEGAGKGVGGDIPEQRAYKLAFEDLLSGKEKLVSASAIFAPDPENRLRVSLTDLARPSSHNG